MYLDQLKEHFQRINEWVREVRTAAHRQGVPDPFYPCHSECYSEPQPCTEEEVRKAEEKLGCRLPATYREFLLWMGHTKWLFLAEWGFYYEGDLWKEIVRNRKKHWRYIKHFIPQAEFIEDVLIIWQDPQGCGIKFIRLSEGDDPPVYHWGDSPVAPPFWREYRHFSDFLADELDMYVWHVGKHAREAGFPSVVVEEWHQFSNPPDTKLHSVKEKVEDVNAWIQEAAARIRYEEGKGYLITPQPCTEEEVREFERQLGRSLPVAYREFLLMLLCQLSKGRN
jgi:hypothetical protein